MRERTGNHFLDDLFDFLNDAIDSGTEVHIVDHSDPGHVKEHVFNADEDDDDFGPDDIEGDIEDKLPFAYDECFEGISSCDDCSHFDECYAEEIADCECCGDYDPPMWGIPDIERVVFNDPATVVFWADGTKTVVKCMECEKFERYAGFIAACAKKMFGSTSRAKAIMEECAYDQPPKIKKERLVGMREKANPIDDALGVDHETIMEAVNEALER